MQYMYNIYTEGMFDMGYVDADSEAEAIAKLRAQRKKLPLDVPIELTLQGTRDAQVKSLNAETVARRIAPEIVAQFDALRNNQPN